MPFRHLLFNKRDGAPQRPPDAQPISLDSARYFSLDAEFPSYSWPDDGYTPQPTHHDYHPAASHNHQLAKPHALSHAQTFDHPTQQIYPGVTGPSYHGTLYNLQPGSFSYSDLMDTDTSSVSRGSFHSSISSTSHLEIAFDTDGSSLNSLSRKGSSTSSYNPDMTTRTLCPLLSGQVGQCSPNLCGPDAPCLQYVNNGFVPRESCLPISRPNRRSNLPPPRSQPNEDAYVERTATQKRQRSATVAAVNPESDTSEPQQLTPTEETKVSPTELNRPTSDSTNGTTKKAQAVPTGKRSKARQAHSLVERKYRENLNAKIQELHVRSQPPQPLTRRSAC